jgi:transglutaminase-like putative cysteine protease
MTFAFAMQPAELSLEHKRLLWTVAIVLGASLPHWATLSPWIPALLIAAIAWRLAVAFCGWPTLSRLVRVPLSLTAFLAVLLQYRTLNGIEAGSALLVVMVALKVLESRSQRDQLVLIMICYFLMFAGLLADRGPLTAGYIVLLVWLATVALIQIGRRGPLLPYRATGRLSGRLLLHAIPVMVVLFVLFPRLPGPLWAIPGSTSSGTTGLNDTMSPGDITNLALSDEVAFRVAFDGLPPRASDLYWRGPSLANFNGRTWSMRQGMSRGERVAATIEYLGEPTSYRVTLEPNGRNWAFALDMPRAWSGDSSLRMGSDYQLGTFFGGPRPRRLEYGVVSHVDYRAREPLIEAEREMFRALPEGSNPRARQLAETWLADGARGAAIVDRAMGYLRSQPFAYTLTPPALGAQPVDEFLFETREGFCEHYASALTFLLRAAGLPARVVMGYQGGELNALGGYYIVRQTDAHAWTEVWLADEGWVRVDGVAAVAPERVALGFDGLRSGGATAAAAALRALWSRPIALLWDAVNTRWQAWIVGYGPQLQRSLLESLGFTNLRRAQRSAVLLGLAVVTTLTVLIALRAYLAWRHRQRAQVDAAALCFAAFVRKLARLDVAARAPTEGPRTYAERAAAALPLAAARIHAISALYLRARYEPDAHGTALAALAAEVAAFRGGRTARAHGAALDSRVVKN